MSPGTAGPDPAAARHAGRAAARPTWCRPRWWCCEALPLTVNGKLDTRALPAPEYTDVDRYRAPTNAVEEILAGIYAQVLGLERVGVDDSFFDLGGDSLSAMRVIAAVNTGLDADLVGAHLVRRAHGGPVGAPSRWRRRVGVSRWWPASGPRWCRCRSPRTGCGSSTSCRGPHRSTTWRWRCG